MDYILLSENSYVIAGLEKLMNDKIGNYELASFVSVEQALLIITIAKLCEDTFEYFPRGKWATIQNIEMKIQNEVAKIMKGNM